MFLFYIYIILKISNLKYTHLDKTFSTTPWWVSPNNAKIFYVKQFKNKYFYLIIYKRLKNTVEIYYKDVRNPEQLLSLQIMKSTTIASSKLSKLLEVLLARLQLEEDQNFHEFYIFIRIHFLWASLHSDGLTMFKIDEKVFPGKRLRNFLMANFRNCKNATESG